MAGSDFPSLPSSALAGIMLIIPANNRLNEMSGNILNFDIRIFHLLYFLPVAAS
jgi:hypothetical protein